MDEKLKIGLLKKGGKKELAAYNMLKRVTGPAMNLGTRSQIFKPEAATFMCAEDGS